MPLYEFLRLSAFPVSVTVALTVSVSVSVTVSVTVFLHLLNNRKVRQSFFCEKRRKTETGTGTETGKASCLE
jgi:hypothetical protein